MKKLGKNNEQINAFPFQSINEALSGPNLSWPGRAFKSQACACTESARPPPKNIGRKGNLPGTLPTPGRRNPLSRTRMKSEMDTINPDDWLSDAQWDVLRPVLLRIRNTQGPHERQSDREFLTAVAYLVKTGSPWRALPPQLGDWHAVYVRFRRWENARVWAYLKRDLDDRAIREISSILPVRAKRAKRGTKTAISAFPNACAVRLRWRSGKPGHSFASCKKMCKKM